jgi:hypothetical protein
MVDVVDGLEDREQRVVVPLQLGPLVRVDGVLHGQRVQPELLGDPGEFLIGRLVQTDPCEAAIAAHVVHRLTGSQTAGVLDPSALPVDRAVHDRGARRVVAGGVVVGVRGGALAQRGAQGGQ